MDSQIPVGPNDENLPKAQIIGIRRPHNLNVDKIIVIKVFEEPSKIAHTI